ncbi:MAG TPA: CARDB domain-containing protein [Candidatus Udaeobacter sp.]|nr:CARDB domain-containing protein [Candidatus Udaeobacter sp.]
MWNIWEPDGSWWYEMFYIPAKPLDPPPEKPDLIIIDPLVVQSDAWVGDSVPVKISTKNQGGENSGPFTVGIVGTSIKSEVISNIPPGQIKTVTVNVTSSTNGIKKFTAMTDFGLAVAESKEDNNTKPFQIAFNKKNEPTTPVAIISHLEGDHRSIPEITINPGEDPNLDDQLSYSPGGEAITLQEWRYRPPGGSVITRKPAAKDFVQIGDYLVELRVTNSANKVSGWAQLSIKVEEEVNVVIPPDPAINVDIEFDPPKIMTGETSSLVNYNDDVYSHTWKFSNNLAAVLPNQTDTEYRNITFNQPGIYKAEMTGWNGSLTGKDTAYLQVIDPKPVAVVTGITHVIQGRDFPFPHHLLNSYTPLADRGVTINFSKSEMRYKKTGQSGYTAGWPEKAPMELGTYSIEGKVYDSEGRVSEWGTLLLEVVEDAPPSIQIIAPDEAYRSSGIMLYMNAESPDGDQLEHLTLEERYDQDGDGDFIEEAWTMLYDGDFKWTHSLNYAAVGKRQYRATVTEDYGKQGISALAAAETVNRAPEVNFNVSGTIQQPDQGEDSAPPITNYTPDNIFRSWAAKNPYTGGTANKLGWKPAASSISTKTAVLADFFIGYPNMGLGSNARSKYNLASDLAVQTPWKDNGMIIKAVFAGHRIYTVTAGISDTIYEKSAITGALLRTISIHKEGYSYLTIDKKENFYYSNYDSSTRILKIRIYNKTGVLLGEHSITNDITVQSLSILYSEISADSRYLYLITRQGYSSGTEYALSAVKYDMTANSTLWNIKGQMESYYPTFIGGVKGTITANGELLISYTTESNSKGNDIWILYARNNGVMSQLEVISGTDVSYPTMSDNGAYIYVASSSQTSNNKNFSSKLNTIPVTAASLGTVINGSNETWTAGSVLFDSEDKYGIGTPVVRADSTVYTTTKVNYGDHLYYSNGSAYQGENTKGEQAADYKMFLLPNGNISIPRITANEAQISTGISSFVWASGTSKTYTKTLNYSSTNTVGMLGGNFQQYADDTNMTAILPDGSLYFFDKNGYVVPYLSASILGGASSGYPKILDTDTIEVIDDNWAGLLYDAGSSMKNYNFEFDVSVNNLENAKVIGSAFHIQNEKNMYAVEWSKDNLTLFKVVNGAKTSLQTVPLSRSSFTPYAFKVEAVNGTLRVYINNSKKIETTDSTFTKGAAGIMSLGQPQAAFSNVKKNNYGDMYIEETYEAVLVNDPILYDKIFKDAEKDPMGAEEWSYSHNPNFFENPEGISIHNGQTYGSTINALEKAGVYEISFRAQDNTGLSAYNRWSEPVKKLLYVHRRPLAQPDVRFTGNVFAEGEALDYETFDTSYDPDIAHILSDKVFRTRWADESIWTAGKRDYYNRPGVELIVQERVRDIHGAWSYWGQHIVYKDALPPINQTKPVMTITSPAGTTAAAPTALAKEPMIRWTYFDAENDPQEQYRLTVSYVDNNETALYIEHEGNALAYSLLEGSIVPGRVVKVQGQVYSAGGWSNLSSSRYFVLDLPPETFLLNFNGTDADHPIYTNANRPQLRVFTVDPENHPITDIDYEVFRASTGANLVDTNSATAAASYTTAALEEGLHYWRARANDSYLWGSYSRNGFFFVDTLKPDDVNERLVIEPTAVTVTFDAFRDVEPSSGHASRTFYLQKVNADGSVTNIDLNGDGTTEYSIPLALDRKFYQVTGLAAGQQYRLTVLDYDAAGNEGHFAYIHFVTNRPPTAAFDWTPKPVYEGDMTSFLSNVGDADGNPLSIAYELTNPAGAKSSYSYTEYGPSYEARGPSLKLTTAGTWSMTMTVSDGIADPVSITQSLQVLPLEVIGYVKHTDLWDKRRRDYNAAQTGQTDSPRYYSVFWAGEKFILEADTTSTGTATKAERVEVKMTDYAAALHKTNDAQTSWSGEMWDNAFTQLKQGKIKFLFTAYFTNGTMKEAAVEVSIDGNTLNTVGVHRVQ